MISNRWVVCLLLAMVVSYLATFSDTFYRAVVVMGIIMIYYEVC